MDAYIQNLISLSSYLVRVLSLNLTIINSEVVSFDLYIIRQENFNLYREQ